jgi:hypothetical protein
MHTPEFAHGTPCCPTVIPAKAGTHGYGRSNLIVPPSMDPRFRGDDGFFGALRIRHVFLSLIALTLALPAHAATRCAPGESKRSVAELFMGLSRHHGEPPVTEQQFTDFLDREVSSRFADGMTLYDAQGRWLTQGHVIHEPSKVIMIVLPGRADDRKRLSDIAAAYNSRFDQEAVLITVGETCAVFESRREPVGG